MLINNNLIAKSCILSALLFVHSAPCCCQDDAANAADPVTALWKNLDGFENCRGCHEDLRQDSPFSRDFCELNELTTWVQKDKHAIARRRVEPLNLLTDDDVVAAYGKLKAELKQSNIELTGVPKNLLGPSNVLSFIICKNLSIDPTTEAGYGKFRSQCLSCHGGYTDASQDQQFSLTGHQQPGISCNYCHENAAKLPKDPKNSWVNHGAIGFRETWRLLDPAAKENAGMRNLVSISERAKLCSDCHIGNIQQGQFVTHEMYAAGHPPLPSFELQTFVDAMPKHWRDTNELLAVEEFKDKSAYMKANFPATFAASQGKVSSVYWNTRQLLVGAIESHIRLLELLNQAAEQESHWGNFALYDCGACHHELRTPSSRQQHRTTVPGRPLAQEWSQGLLHVALAIAGADSDWIDNFDRSFNELFERRPFGDRLQVLAKTKEQIEKLRRVSERVQGMNIDAATSQRVSELVLNQVDASSSDIRQHLDYHSARQIIWALEVVAQDFTSHNDKRAASVKAVLDAFRGQDESAMIDTKLPAGRAEFIYDEYLKNELTRRANYSFENFSKRLRDSKMRLQDLGNR